MVMCDNPRGYPGLPAHNLSLACNHCEYPACLTGCPAGAYHRDDITGAIILSAHKCLGCNYCFWNCPFDAPHYDGVSKNVQKCHLCYERVAGGGEPACTSACPTGALSFDYGSGENKTFGLIPDTDINPGLEFVPPRKIIHQGENKASNVPSKVPALSEWSLILFTYISSLLFGFSFSSLSGGFFPGQELYISLSVICLLIPLIHLGHPFRAWRAIMNIRRSPLSAEIGMLLIFIIISNLAIINGIPLLMTASFITGLLLMVIIDNVYTSADRRMVMKIHPGQVFLSALVFASLFGGETRALIFIVLLKLALNIWVRFFRLRTALNIITGIIFTLLLLGAIINELNNGSPVVSYIMVMAGELINRAAYYFDFAPPGVINIYLQKSTIDEKQ